MKYAVIDIKDGELYAQLFDTEEGAIHHAECRWNSLSESEKRKREIFHVMYGDVDDNGCFVLETAQAVRIYK